MKPTALFVPAALCALLASTGRGLVAQHPAEAGLATARAAYEQAIEDVRARVRAELAKSKADVEVRQDHRDRFTQAGSWPPLAVCAGRADLQRQADAALAELLGAYKRCLEAVFDDDELAKAIRRESDQWKKVNDLVAWRAVPAPKPAAGGEPKENGGVAPDTVLLPVRLVIPYRLEVRGTAKADAPLHLLLPVPEKPIAVPIVRSGESFRVVVTVGPDGVIAADLGLRRETMASVDLPETGGAAAVRGTGVVVELVQWKPAPVDAELVARQAAIAAAETEAANKDKERRRKDLLAKRQKLEKKLGDAEARVQRLSAEIARDEGQWDVSDLRSDRARWQKEAEAARRELETINGELADLGGTPANRR